MGFFDFVDRRQASTGTKPAVAPAAPKPRLDLLLGSDGQDPAFDPENGGTGDSILNTLRAYARIPTPAATARAAEVPPSPTMGAMIPGLTAPRPQVRNLLGSGAASAFMGQGVLPAGGVKPVETAPAPMPNYLNMSGTMMPMVKTQAEGPKEPDTIAGAAMNAAAIQADAKRKGLVTLDDLVGGGQPAAPSVPAVPTAAAPSIRNQLGAGPGEVGINNGDRLAPQATLPEGGYATNAAGIVTKSLLKAPGQLPGDNGRPIGGFDPKLEDKSLSGGQRVAAKTAAMQAAGMSDSGDPAANAKNFKDTLASMGVDPVSRKSVASGTAGARNYRNTLGILQGDEARQTAVSEAAKDRTSAENIAASKETAAAEVLKSKQAQAAPDWKGKYSIVKTKQGKDQEGYDIIDNSTGTPVDQSGLTQTDARTIYEDTLKSDKRSWVNPMRYFKGAYDENAMGQLDALWTKATGLPLAQAPHRSGKDISELMKPAEEAAPVAGAKKAADGKWYLKDPKSGQWHRVDQEQQAA